MTTSEVADAYGSRARGLAEMLGTEVSSADPDRAIVEPWAAGVTGRILDVGSGTGRWAGHLAALGHRVDGVEPAAEFVEIARRAHPNVEFFVAAVSDLASPDHELGARRWSAILAWYSLIHLPPEQMPGALTTLRRALTDDGSLLISFFTGPRLEEFDHPVTLAYRWPARAMADELRQAGFTVTGHTVHPGGMHASITARTAADRLPEGNT